MARLDRFKYIPMFMRAYQEVRNRSGLTTARESLLDSDTVAQTDVTVPPPPAYKPASTRSPRARKNRKRGRRRQNPQRHRRAATRANAADLRVDNLLRELRATNKQLNKLQTIQKQLSHVQSTLDEQIQVLRRSVESETKSDGMVPPPTEHTDV